MTVTANDARVGPIVGDGATANISVDFEFRDHADLLVTQRLLGAGGTETVMVLDTDYSVSGGDGSTGTVTITLPGTTWTSAYSMVVTRNEPLSSTYNPTSFTSVDAETLEVVIDRIVMKLQELEEITSRCIRYQVTEANARITAAELPLAPDRASTTFGFDANGDPELT